MMVSLSLAVAVPSSPGFIGVFQFVGQQALVIPFGVKYSPGAALAITVVAYLVYYVLSTLLGAVGLFRLGQSFSGLRQLVAGERHQDISGCSNTKGKEKDEVFRNRLCRLHWQQSR